MNYIEKYKSMGILSENAAFEYLISNLKDTIRTYDFFVAWEKVLGNVAKVEVALNNCKATGYWKTNSVKYNFLLLAHEYLFVFRKV